MRLAESMDRVIMVLNIAEVMPLMSESIMVAGDGVYDEALWRSMRELHRQLEELARQAKTVDL